MRAEKALQRQLERARALIGSRDPAVAKSARRAFGSTVIALDGWRNKGELRPYIEAVLRAAMILQALAHRDRRAADRRRGRQLQTVSTAAPRKFSDAELEAALCACNGSTRQAARLLQVQPSTVSRRRVALGHAAQQAGHAVTSDGPRR